MDEQFIIRDGRKRGRYSIDHALFAKKHQPKGYNKTWAALIKPTGVTVYNAIVHHADYHTQDCYPSYTTLAEITGMSLSQVKREVKKLNDFQLIHTITPEDKKTLPDIPEEEKGVNTYIILDKSEWIVPENYKDNYAPATRSDKGKANPKRSKKKRKGVSDRHGEAVSDRHGEAVSDRHGEVVSDRHGNGVSQTREMVSDRHPNKDQLNNAQLTLPTTTIKSGGNVPLTTGQNNQKTGGDVGETINNILSQKERTERITAGHVKKICVFHALQSSEEILKAIQYLASQNFMFAGKHIDNLIGFLIGSKNGSDTYNSNCFFSGECVFPELESEPESKPEATTEHSQEIETKPEIDWKIEFHALPEATQSAIRARAETKLASHKGKMKPEVYAETLTLATSALFREWRQEQNRSVLYKI